MLMNVFPIDSPAYFPVSMKDVYVGNADQSDPAEAFHAVTRDDTGDVLGIHRGQYQLVPNREVYQAFEAALMESGINLQGVTVSEGLAYQGRTSIRCYHFPAVTVTPRVGDIVEFRLKVINSYDASTAFRAIASGMRLVCRNGMVLPDRASSVYARHTSGFDTNRAVSNIQKALEWYLGMEGIWNEWASREITHREVFDVFQKMPDINPARLNWLQDSHVSHARRLGNTVWALYNALTSWSSHAPVRTASQPNQAAIVINRETAVQKTLSSNEFRRLAA